MAQDDARHGYARPNGVPRNGTARRRALIADPDPSIGWLLRGALADDFDLTVAEDAPRACLLRSS